MFGDKIGDASNGNWTFTFAKKLIWKLTSPLLTGISIYKLDSLLVKMQFLFLVPMKFSHLQFLNVSDIYTGILWNTEEHNIQKYI